MVKFEARMRVKTTPVLALLFISLTACKTYNVNNLPKNRIEFGSGGGFTGFEEKYIVLKNGQVFFTPMQDSLAKQIFKLKRNAAKKYITFFTKNNFSQIPNSPPNNYYNYIKLVKKDTVISKSWIPGNKDFHQIDSVLRKINIEITPQSSNSK